MGVPGKIPRVVPSEGATFCGRYIPAGTVVSHSAYVYQMDSRTFKDPETFMPERWLETNSAELEQHLINFSRGSRSCLGIKYGPRSPDCFEFAKQKMLNC